MGAWRDLLPNPYEGLTEGQLADLSAEEDMIDESQFDNYHKPTKPEVRLNIMQGKIAEMCVGSELKDEGYEYTKTHLSYPIEIFNEKHIRIFLEKNEYKEDIDELMKYLKENWKGLPDFICLKDGVVSFCEVKSNKSKISDVQLQVIKELRNKGFVVCCRRVFVDLKITESRNEKI